MSVVIKVENLSKLYRLGEVGTGTLSHDLNRMWAKVRGKEDPFAKVGQVNDRSQKAESDYVWSLRDINFEIKQGDTVGIIGRNGAGKSTLLKLLSRVTAPTIGSIKINGRVASLLEVGTGFHPEMTGRENIFMNGAVLGMRKNEIAKKLDEIVAFSGVEKYIDTPVKRYSSGMYVRLAFAVAAHLESEILIVDEVLAVGDAEFQKKCIGKMGEVSKGEGRTVLFVSHNMGSIRQLCNTGIVLENGELKKISGINDSISYYLNSSSRSTFYKQENNENIPVCVTSVELLSNGNDLLDINDEIELKITYHVNNADSKKSIAIRLLKDQSIVSTSFITLNGDYIVNRNKGIQTVIMKNFPKGLLKAGTYNFDVYTGTMRSNPDQIIESKITFDIDVINEDNFSSVYSKERPGVIGLKLNWEKVK